MAEWNLIPYLMVPDAKAAIAFYTKAFGATEVCCLAAPNGGRVVHAEISVNGAKVYLADECGEQATPGGRIGLHLEVPDADAAQDRAASAGAKVVLPVSEMFWGARYGKLEDPFGIVWSVSHQVRQPSQAEIMEAIADWCPNMASGNA
ncbi:MAG TPA: VOC family protein [Magnetospirillum sp.]|jgi:PhnB protein|nr:VOC family protein [Magnetospirillum sp.]